MAQCPSISAAAAARGCGQPAGWRTFNESSTQLPWAAIRVRKQDARACAFFGFGFYTARDPLFAPAPQLTGFREVLDRFQRGRADMLISRE